MVIYKYLIIYQILYTNTIYIFYIRMHEKNEDKDEKN